MLSLLKKMLSSILALGVLVPLGGCATVGRFMHKNPDTAQAWTAWERGDLELARSLGENLLAEPETGDAGHHILVLVAHVQGDHRSAIAHQAQISPKYRWLSHLDEPTIWSHVHSGDIEGALGFARRRRLDRSTITRLRLAADLPLSVELGPILGTHILQQFLMTIDAPNGRMFLSRRGNGQARRGHLARLGNLPGKIHEIPFALWLSHCMIAHGSVNSRPARFFVDSGLVAINDNKGQPSLLASHGAISSWGASVVNAPLFSKVPGKLCIGTACRKDATAYPVKDNVWKSFGDWGGGRVDALVSWGFLSHFTWTIDFDGRIFSFVDPGKRAE